MGILAGRIAVVTGPGSRNCDDVSDFSGAGHMIATACDAVGGLDILVNNARIKIAAEVDTQMFHSRHPDLVMGG